MQSPAADHPQPGLLRSLLNGRARALRQLHDSTRAFAASVRAGELGGLEEFQCLRAKRFELLGIYDRKIEALAAELLARSEGLAREQQGELRAALVEAERLTTEALEADRELAGCLQQARAQVLDQLASARKGQAAISKFKSQWLAEAGEGLDKTL